MTTDTLAAAPAIEVAARAPIVVGLDGAPDSKRALDWALAEAESRGATVTVCHVESQPPYDAPDADPVLADAAAQVLRRPSSIAIRYLPMVGNPAERLVDAAVGAGLLVVGARGRTALGALLLGSVSEHVAREAPCPVVVVRASNDDPAVKRRGRIVVGVDSSPASVAAIAFAFDHALRHRLGLPAIHAFDPGAVPTMTYLPEETLRGLRESTAAELGALLAPQSDAHPNVHVTFEVMHGTAASTLLGAATGADLLVLGSRGHSSLVTRLLGSTSHTVLHHAPCPVTIVQEQKG
jgi:nucleotide-binding universal stress UspA family protein